MVAVGSLIDQEHGTVAQIVDDGLHAAIVPKVGNREAAAGKRLAQARAGAFGDIAEAAVAEVPIKEARLLKRCAKLRFVYLRVNVAVDDQQIGVAVVVYVGKHGAPAKRHWN